MSDTFSSSGGNIQGRGPVRPYRSRAKASGRILILFHAISSSPSSEVYTLLGLLPGYSLSNLTTLQAAAEKTIWGFADRAVLNLVWLQKLDSIDAWDRPSHRLHPRKSSPTEIFIRGTYWRSVPQMEVFTYRASSIGELVDSTPSTGKFSRPSTPVTLGKKVTGGPTSLPLLLDMIRIFLLTVFTKGSYMMIPCPI